MSKIYCHDGNDNNLLQILGKEIHGIECHNKSTLNVMGIFVIISTTRTQHGISTIGT